MDKKHFKRFVFPVLLFSAFLLFATMGGSIIGQFSNQAVSTTKKVFYYIIQIGLWVSAAALINTFINVLVWDNIIAKALGASPPKLLKDVCAVLLYLIAVTGIVGFVFKKPVTGIWATSGVIGLVLGIALQSMIMDVFTGVAINIEQPFKIGHLIEIPGVIYGRILEINWRTTRIKTFDKNVIIIPNSVMGKTTIKNYSMPDAKCTEDITFTLDFSIPIPRAKRILQAGAKAALPKHEGFVKTQKPNILVMETTEFGVQYKVLYGIDTGKVLRRKSNDIMHTSIMDHFHKAGITLAYPKHDIYYDKMPVRHLDHAAVEDRIELVSRIEIFSPLTDEEHVNLVENMHEKLFKEGDALIKRGEQGDSMFILMEGLLDVYVPSGNGDGDVCVGQIQPSEFFGEMSLLTGEPRSATIKAASESLVYVIGKNDIVQILQKRPELGTRISHVVAERQLKTSNALLKAQEGKKPEEIADSIAAQIFTKMKSFFKGIFS